MSYRVFGRRTQIGDSSHYSCMTQVFSPNISLKNQKLLVKKINQIQYEKEPSASDHVKQIWDCIDGEKTGILTECNSQKFENFETFLCDCWNDKLPFSTIGWYLDWNVSSASSRRPFKIIECPLLDMKATFFACPLVRFCQAHNEICQSSIFNLTSFHCLLFHSFLITVPNLPILLSLPGWSLRRISGWPLTFQDSHDALCL